MKITGCHVNLDLLVKLMVSAAILDLIDARS